MSFLFAYVKNFSYVCSMKNKVNITAHSLSPQGDELITVLNVDRKAITNNCVGKSKSSGGFIWSKIKKENIYE